MVRVGLGFRVIVAKKKKKGKIKKSFKMVADTPFFKKKMIMICHKTKSVYSNLILFGKFEQ